MKIAILEYNTGEVIIKDVPKQFEELDGDDILTNMGYNIGTTEYMIVNNILPVSISTQDCTIKTTLM